MAPCSTTVPCHARPRPAPATPRRGSRCGAAVSAARAAAHCAARARTRSQAAQGRWPRAGCRVGWRPPQACGSARTRRREHAPACQWAHRRGQRNELGCCACSSAGAAACCVAIKVMMGHARAHAPPACRRCVATHLEDGVLEAICSLTITIEAHRPPHTRPLCVQAYVNLQEHVPSSRDCQISLREKGDTRTCEAGQNSQTGASGGRHLWLAVTVVSGATAQKEVAYHHQAHGPCARCIGWRHAAANTPAEGGGGP
jgi:hypothetical protein